MKITLPPITQGDWHPQESTAVFSDNGYCICDTDPEGRNEPEDAVNMKAIAAVPALLRALVSALEHFEGRAHYSPLQIRKADEIRAALTLAGCVIEP